MKNNYVIIAIKDSFTTYLSFKTHLVESSDPIFLTEKTAKSQMKKIETDLFDQVFIAQFISI